MHGGKLVFAQLMDFIAKRDFNECVDRYRGNYRVREFSCRDQFLAMAFAQLTLSRQPAGHRDLLERPADETLSRRLSRQGLPKHLGRRQQADATGAFGPTSPMCSSVGRGHCTPRTTSASALKQTAYAWTPRRSTCASPCSLGEISSSQGGGQDAHLDRPARQHPLFYPHNSRENSRCDRARSLAHRAGAFYMMDKGYIDFERLHAFTRQMAFFVTRAKSNVDCTRRESREVDKSTGLRSDQTIVLQGRRTSHFYPTPLRRVAYYDAEHHRRLVFLTNNFDLPALTIARLYRCRWQVELFFKWIKQNLRIKVFYGNSVNAVKTQVWIAVSVYVLVALLKKELNLDRSLTEILQILSVTPFERTPIFQALSTFPTPNCETSFCNQLALFEL